MTARPMPGSVGEAKLLAKEADDAIRDELSREAGDLMRRCVAEWATAMTRSEGETYAAKYRHAVDALLTARNHLRGYQ